MQSDITGLKASDLGIVDTNQYCYILTYSFPCQDLSIAGKQAGMKKGSKTRSGLLWEVERLLNECTELPQELPQVLLMENVTQVHSKKNSADFNKWIESLEDLGYSNYYADLNAKNYGVPQNRNRTFMISILGNYFYEFPMPFKLEKRLKDILEKDVDEKYYLSSTISATDNTIIEEVIGSTQKNAYRGSLDGPCPALTTAMGEGDGNIPMIKQVAQLYPNSGNPQAGRIYDTDGLCCSIDTAQGGNRMPKIIEIGDSIDINYPNSTTRRGRHIKAMAHTITSENNSQVAVGDDTYKNRPERQYDDCCPPLRNGRSGFKIQTEPCIAASRGRNPNNPSDRTAGIKLQQRLEFKTDGTSNTLTTVQKDNLLVEPTCRIRRLIPKECFRLMTFDDTDFEKCKAAGISDSQLYKQAGNSIVVDVLVKIFAQLFEKK